MKGLMQETPLLIGATLDHASRFHRSARVVSRQADGGLVTHSYDEIADRVSRLATALLAMGIRSGDRVGTLGWNDHRHLEIYFAASGIGAICHTINPRLFDDQIVHIVADARDRVLFVDPEFLPMLDRIGSALAEHGVDGLVVLTHARRLSCVAGLRTLSYEDLLDQSSVERDWPELEESQAALLCYTSGTTGMPKGVLYSHRSTVLHAMAICLPDVFGLRAVDRVLPVVPMYHVNAWGLPFAAALTGASLVLPGARPNSSDLVNLIEECRITVGAAVPTVWLGVLDELRRRRTQNVEGLRLICGGAACPGSLIRSFHDEFGITISHAWGMTELSPLGLFNARKPESEAMPTAGWLDHQRKQGRPLFLMDLRVVDSEGAAIPHDGVAFGELQVRGPWVIESYYKGMGKAVDADGWFSTGDIVTIDEAGTVEIVDRAKDVIKSGGEWISSIALENLAAGHPDVAEAAVIGASHERWDERPVLLIVPCAMSRPPTHEDMLAWFDGKVARWWLPDRTILLDELPHTATGKLNKVELKQRFGGCLARG